MTPRENVLTIDDHELSVILSALNRSRKATVGLIRRDEARGWKPPEGRENMHVLRLRTIDALLRQYGRGG